jgi:hypothetical protein
MPPPLVASSSPSSSSSSSSSPPSAPPSAPPSPPPYSAPPSPAAESPRSDYPPASEWTVACPNCARPLNCCGACPGDYVLDNGAHCCSSNCRWTVLLGGDRRRLHRRRLHPNRPPNHVNNPRRHRQRVPVDTSDVASEPPQTFPGLVDEPFFDIVEP